METIWIEHDTGICWEESMILREAGLCHGVTGRGGGVSAAPYNALNLALHVGDDPTAVLENRRRLCQTIGCSLQNLTMAQQTHEDHVVAVGKSECGSGAGSYYDALAHTDALMTNVPGIPLLICVADCVPVILYDPVRRACAVVHDGWRGTAAKLAAKTAFAMKLAYGSQPEQMLAYIGPSISAPHFEVSEDTAQKFEAIGYGDCVIRNGGTRYVDLWQANVKQLLDAGLTASHVSVTQSCVFEQEDKFFSYRRDGGVTGRIGAFAMIPEE